MAQAPDEPDWSIWSKADAVELQDAVALSIDIGPGGQRHHYAKSGGKLERMSDPTRDHYHERLTLSLSHIGRDLPLVGPPLPPEMPQETNKVRLVDFAAFASRMGWNLADNFPWKEMTYVDDKGNEVTLVNVDGKQMVRTPAGGYITQEQWHDMTHPPREPIPPEVVIATSIQEAGVSNVPVVKLVQTSKPKPNWEYWINIPEAAIINAVYLSCDIEPRAIKPGELGEHPSSELYQFWQRLLIASANAVSGALRRVRSNPGTRLLPGCIFDDVNLVEFSSWVNGLPDPWELSPKFPRVANRIEVLSTQAKQPAQKVTPSEQEDASEGGDQELGKLARGTLLMIIAGALGDNLGNPATAAAMVERRLQSWGIDRPKKRMILNWLNESKRLLEESKAKD